jgi:endonuclease/exonuclease/phosphatase family metal-dependent hydrolase
MATGGLVLVALAMPLFAPSDASRLRSRLRIAAVLCALARIPLSVDIPAMRTLAATATLGFAGMYLAGLLGSQATTLGWALSLGAIVDQILRALGNTYDLGLRPWWGFVQTGLSIGILLLTESLLRGEEPRRPEDAGGLGGGLALGSAFFVIGSLLALPNAGARWTEGAYPLLVTLSLALSMVPLWPRLYVALDRQEPLQMRWLRGAVVLVGLTGLVIAERKSGGIPVLALTCAGIVFWLFLPISLRVGRRGARVGLALGIATCLVLSTLHALSFTYAYVSPAFRGAALPAFALGYLVSLAPAVAAREPRMHTASLLSIGWQRIGLALSVAVCVLGLTVALPPQQKLVRTVDSIRVGSYNIHYGFDSHWRFALEEQARTIQESRADLVALQEVDTGRLTSYGVDTALWLSRRLGMRAVYLPTVEHLTGIAVLSRLHVLDTGGRLLPSAEEPTGIVRVRVNLEGAPISVYGLWLGLSPQERERQLRAVVDYVDRGRAIVAGDMNTTPDSPIYAAMYLVGFRDPFVELGQLPAPTDPAISPIERIDYVWLRGLSPLDAYVLPSLASDHRMVIIEAE